MSSKSDLIERYRLVYRADRDINHIYLVSATKSDAIQIAKSIDKNTYNGKYEVIPVDPISIETRRERFWLVYVKEKKFNPCYFEVVFSRKKSDAVELYVNKRHAKEKYVGAIQLVLYDRLFIDLNTQSDSALKYWIIYEETNNVKNAQLAYVSDTDADKIQESYIKSDNKHYYVNEIEPIKLESKECLDYWLTFSMGKDPEDFNVKYADIFYCGRKELAVRTYAKTKHINMDSVGVLKMHLLTADCLESNSESFSDSNSGSDSGECENICISLREVDIGKTNSMSMINFFNTVQCNKYIMCDIPYCATGYGRDTGIFIEDDPMNFCETIIESLKPYWIDFSCKSEDNIFSINVYRDEASDERQLVSTYHIFHVNKFQQEKLIKYINK